MFSLELELRLMRAINPQRSKVRTESAQDEADSRHIRLTPAQGAALMMRPDLSWLRGRGDMRHQEAADSPMTTRSVQRMLGRYPISIDGQQRAVRPHDLRQSYARNLIQRLCFHAQIQKLAGVLLRFIANNTRRDYKEYV
ncbi:MAG: hypothetical protein OXG78_07020 [Chloroflexi bacterium]|nr:hypothetical protein [Chloroflexota bacterium]